MQRILEYTTTHPHKTVCPSFKETTAKNCFKKSDMGDHRVLVMGIVGPKRSAKSFLACVSTSFLDFASKTPNATGEMFLQQHAKIEGVNYKQSAQAVTKGVEVLSKPFLIQRNEKKAAISLIDCQGMFDTEVNYATIDAMNTACVLEMSSVTILNVRGSLDGPNLENMENCMRFLGSSKFRTLEILHRDWQSGGQPGRRKNAMSERSETEKNAFQKFDDVSDFMLPIPGCNVLNASEEDHLDLQELLKDPQSREMIKHLVQFLEELLDKYLNDDYLRSHSDIEKLIERLAQDWSGKIDCFDNPTDAFWAREARRRYHDTVPEIDKMYNTIAVEKFTERALETKLRETGARAVEMVTAALPPDPVSPNIKSTVESEINCMMKRLVMENADKVGTTWEKRELIRQIQELEADYKQDTQNRDQVIAELQNRLTLVKKIMIIGAVVGLGVLGGWYIGSKIVEQCKTAALSAGQMTTTAASVGETTAKATSAIEATAVAASASKAQGIAPSIAAERMARAICAIQITDFAEATETLEGLCLQKKSHQKYFSKSTDQQQELHQSTKKN